MVNGMVVRGGQTIGLSEKRVPERILSNNLA
jgi:hypothetical protein